MYTIEIRASLAHEAEAPRTLGYKKVHVRTGDGYAGWPEAAPFDAIVVTAAPPRIPQPLLDQLAVGGRMVIPVGSFYQQLKVITRRGRGLPRARRDPGAVRPHDRRGREKALAGP